MPSPRNIQLSLTLGLRRPWAFSPRA